MNLDGRNNEWKSYIKEHYVCHDIHLLTSRETVTVLDKVLVTGYLGRVTGRHRPFDDPDPTTPRFIKSTSSTHGHTHADIRVRTYTHVDASTILLLVV